MCIGREVRHGGCTSPTLFNIRKKISIFNIYNEDLMKEGLKGFDRVIIGGKRIMDIKYADEQEVVANSEEGVKTMMNKKYL